MNVMERQIAERAAQLELELWADGRVNVVRSLGERLGKLAVDGWPRDFTVYFVVVKGEQISMTDAKFYAGDLIKKLVRVDEVGETLRSWARKGRPVTSVEVL